MISSILRAKSG
jgi:hypothetical protein